MGSKRQTRKRRAERSGISTAASPSRVWSLGLWLLPLLLLLVQLAWTRAASYQIRMEELAESVRNVYWLEHGKIYDGISSNVGWYATEMAAYRLFGFDIYRAKYIRLFFHLLSLLCAASLLRRWLGSRDAWLPLIALGLSPTLLFFNTMQTSYGMDLQYAPICLLLLLLVRFESKPADLARSSICWAMGMVACMSYPAFLLYMPPLLAAYLWRLRGRREALTGRWRWAHLAAAAAGLLLPMAAALLYMESPAMLLNDPVTGRGIFRGGGKLTADPTLVFDALGQCLRDLLIRGESYYFTVARPDFGGWLGWAAMAMVMGAAIPALRIKGGHRVVIALALAVTLLSLLLPAFTSKGYPGIRRSTGILAGLYLLYAAGWQRFRAAPPPDKWVRWTVTGLFLLLPLNHLLGLSDNYRSLVKPSFYREENWFELRGEPAASLDFILKTTSQKRIPLKCLDDNDRPLPCRYGELFAAMDGYRVWNGLPRLPVLAYDWRTGRDIELSISLWESGHFPR